MNCFHSINVVVNFMKFNEKNSYSFSPDTFRIRLILIFQAEANFLQISAL